MSDEDLKTEIYAALHRGNPGDVAFYRDRCDVAADVLELGCGSGRVMAAIANASGLRVGLDISQSQLNLAQSNVDDPAVVWVQGDMREFSLAERFDRIIIPYNGLYTLPTDADMVACLATAKRHLKPGGRVLFDTYAVTDVAMETHVGPEEPEFLAQLSVGDYEVVVWESERGLPEPRSIEVVYRYDVHERVTNEGRTLEAAIAHHFLRPSDLRAVVRQAGLRLDRLDGGFDGLPLDEDSDHYVVELSVA